MNPYRVLKYNFNNLSGDADIVWAYEPKIITKYMAKAAKDLWADLRNKDISEALKAELLEARRLAVIGSGITIQEIPDITEQGAFKMFTGNDNKNIIARGWKNVKDYTNFRENILRLAAFRYFQDEIKKGRTDVYGASKKSIIDDIADPVERSARLSRELVGDYGNISQAGQWMRRRMIPFYSWMEINAPRYVRLLRNLKHEGKTAKNLSGVMAWKTTKFGLKAATLYALVLIWNATLFPDDEDKLGEERRQLHLILGHRADGSIISVRFQGALSDALSWFGLEDLPTDVKEVVQGKVPVSKKIKEALLAGPERLILGAKPFERTALEALTKRSLYPDVWHPRPIRDRMEHITRTFSLNELYNRATGKPVRGLGATISNLGTFTTEPGQAAYFEIKNKVSTFMKDHDVAPGYAEPTERSTALSYYRKAQRFDDKDMAQKWLKEYIKLGGTRKTMAMAKRASHPYAQLPLKYRSMFFKTLTPADRAGVQRAVGWWQKSF